MPRPRHYLLGLLGGLALLGAGVYLAHDGRPQPPPEPKAVAGLAWLPAQAGLVAGLDLAEMRQQVWLLEMIRRATGEVRESPDYQAFVEATGFDYARDLDHVWVGVFGPSEQPVVVGVAEGRFARAKILAYARTQGSARHRYQGIEIYQVQTGVQNPRPRESGSAKSNQSGRSFAFAFLDNTHLAFASDSERAAMIVDCWLGKAPAVGSDEGRRAAVEQLAAGRQAWVVDELAKWQPPVFQKQEALQALVVQLSLGLRVSGAGVEVETEARCREPGQAERLRDNLRVLVLAARLALGRQRDESSQALGEALGNLALSQQGDTLQARVTLPPETLAALLGVPPAAPSGS